LQMPPFASCSMPDRYTAKLENIHFTVQPVVPPLSLSLSLSALADLRIGIPRKCLPSLYFFFPFFADLLPAVPQFALQVSRQAVLLRGLLKVNESHAASRRQAS